MPTTIQTARPGAMPAATPTTPSQTAQQNLANLAQNPYPGRGIAIGLSPCGEWALQAYWIMGRSQHSQNRRFVHENGVLRTAPVDLSLVTDPALIIYPAMQTAAGWLLATNGHHTITLAKALDSHPTPPFHALQSLCYEPDAPHYTPRIAGGIHLGQQSGWLALAKAQSAIPAPALPVSAPPAASSPAPAPATPAASPHTPPCQRHVYCYQRLPLGAAYCITTYAGDGSPLPPFSGEPWLLPMESHQAQALATHLWAHLSPRTRVSLAVRCVHVVSGQADIALCQRHPLE